MYRNSQGLNSKLEDHTGQITLPPLDPSPRMSTVNEGGGITSKRSSRHDLNPSLSNPSLKQINTRHSNNGFVLPTEENENGERFKSKNSRYMIESKSNSKFEAVS